MFASFKHLIQKIKPERPENRLREAAFIVAVSDGEIINQRPEGKVERVRIADLQAVIIETNDSGPWGSDVWWMLLGAENTGCVFPGGAGGEQDVLEAVQQLPGFDHEAFINAMTCTSNQQFVCWQTAG